jgi:hypothetical protein
MTLILFIAVFLAGCALGMFVLMVAGIQSEERHMRAAGTRRSTRTELTTRRALGVYVRRPAESSDSDNCRR